MINYDFIWAFCCSSTSSFLCHPATSNTRTSERNFTFCCFNLQLQFSLYHQIWLQYEVSFREANCHWQLLMLVFYVNFDPATSSFSTSLRQYYYYQHARTTKMRPESGDHFLMDKSKSQILHIKISSFMFLCQKDFAKKARKKLFISRHRNFFSRRQV